MASDLVEWLQSIRLDQYCPLFQAAGFTTLLHCQSLVDEDLLKIGVEPPGHRRRILQHLPKSIDERNIYSSVENCDDNIQEDSHLDTDFKPPLLPPKRISIPRLSIDSDIEITQKYNSSEEINKKDELNCLSSSDNDTVKVFDEPPKPAPRSQRFLLRYHEKLSPKNSEIQSDVTKENDLTLTLQLQEKLSSFESKPQPLPRKKFSFNINLPSENSNSPLILESEIAQKLIETKEPQCFLEQVIENPNTLILDFLGNISENNNGLYNTSCDKDLILFDSNFDIDDNSDIQATFPQISSSPPFPETPPPTPTPEYKSLTLFTSLTSCSSIPPFSPPPIPHSSSSSSYCSSSFSFEEFGSSPPPVPPRKAEDNLHKKLQKVSSCGVSNSNFFDDDNVDKTFKELHRTLTSIPEKAPPLSRFYLPFHSQLPSEVITNSTYSFEDCKESNENSHSILVEDPAVDCTSHLSLFSASTHSGFLYKTGSSQKDFQKRWFLLKQGRLSYYLDAKSDVPKDSIDCEDIKGLVKHKSKKLMNKFCFDLITVKDKGRYYLLAAEDENVAKLWLSNLAQCFGPSDIMSQIENFDACGYLYVRIGSGGSWIVHWLVLKGKTLNIYFEKDGISEKLDLKKAISLKLITGIGCIETLDDGLYFILDLPGRAVYCQAHLKKITETWFHILDDVIRENGRTLEEQQLTAESIPVIVDKCLKFISTHGSTSKGIYRLNGVHTKIVKLLECFQSDPQSVHLKLEDYCEHDVANMLKRYLRNLPDSIMTNSLYMQWVEISVMTDVNQKLQRYKSVLKEKLPEINYKTLKKLIGHLKSIADLSDKNSMTIGNLAAIFGPTLMSSEREPIAGAYGMASQEIVVVNDLITYYSTLFEVEQSELDKEKKILEALEKMRLAQLPQKPAGDLILGVYVYGKNGKCLNIKVSPQMTANDLCKYAIERENLQDNKLTVYEIIFNGELERPIHFTEKILPATLQWMAWTSAGWTNAAGNYLCIKKHEVFDKVSHMLGPPFSMFSELRFSKGKTFKRFSFEFSRAQLSYYKDARVTSPLKTWNVEDIIWYTGAEHKRSSPTKWCLTFIEKNVEIKKSKENPYFGNTICFDREDELYKWIAAMLCAEYPQGILPQRLMGASPNL